MVVSDAEKQPFKRVYLATHVDRFILGWPPRGGGCAFGVFKKEKKKESEDAFDATRHLFHFTLMTLCVQSAKEIATEVTANECIQQL